MKLHVRERRIPGIGQQWELHLAGGTNLVITLEDRSDRISLAALRPGEDEPSASVSMTDTEALTVASILSGVRYVFDAEPVDVPLDGVHVETVTLGAGSPAIGRVLEQIDVPDPEHARVLAVIRDDTAQLIEEDLARPCQPGDRLVIAGHVGPLRDLRAHLIG